MREWGDPLSPEQAIASSNMHWSFSSGPDRAGATIPTDEIEFAASAPDSSMR